MKISLVLLVVLVISLVGLGIMVTRTKQPALGGNVEIPTSKTPIKIDVEAKNGNFEPRDFTTELFTDLILSVTAADQDYQFSVEGYPRLTDNILKGETKNISISGLGVGEYRYQLNSDGGGLIVVNQEFDEEESEGD